MECTSKTIMQIEDCHYDDQISIKEELSSKDGISTGSQKLHCIEHYVCSSDDDTKIGIKEESCIPNLISSDIKCDLPTLDLVPFIGTDATKNGDEIDKEEHINHDEIPTQSQKHNLLQNGTYFVECDEISDVDTKTGIKQERCDSNTSSVIKSDPEQLFTGTIKCDDEIEFKEESWWCVGASSDSHNQEKECGPGECEASKDVLPFESARLSRKAVYSDVEKDGTSKKAVSRKNASHETSTCSLNSNPAYDPFGSEPNMDDEGTQVYKCEICDKSYSHKSNLRNHKLQHSGTRHKCDTCDKSFTRKANLQSHQLLHSVTVSYKCDICEKYFTTNTILQRHKLLHSATPPHKCNICQKCFATKAVLQRHKLLHSGIELYQCNLCEKHFSRKSHLQSHKLLHLSTTLYKCDTCDKCFTTKAVLQRHKLIHSRTEPYKCDICEKYFSQKFNLQSHKLLHLDTTPHKCDLCEKYFTTKAILQRHKRLHSGTEPYKCEICEKHFTLMSSLKSHKLLHSETSYKCNICKKCYTRKSNLQKHIQLHSDNNGNCEMGVGQRE